MSWTEGNPFAQSGLPAATAKTVAGVRRVNSQAKGKRAERQLAAWWRDNGFPDAARYVKTGDRFVTDGGDLVLEHGEFRLVVEVKHHAGGLTDGQVAEYGTKLLRQVAQSKGTMGILVERRDRVSDASRWWVHIGARDFAILERNEVLTLLTHNATGFQPVRTTVGYFAHLLRSAGLAQVTP